ncbi:1-phosphatidylinositol-4:5-bisphosphate phosphodiesterase epsilon-1-like protein [Dinothrombium tinctorium]|uniref:1-phosphatidylinositol-4:5-bisphosphate phosphodiesterase epsilon-1-like protein n=1 Tax=Dinothrombium tinctorium TaxID=1965070 RepID=A0A3S3PCD9_9ACAR|nr:1-phosphatidylinositol-4:5-bisphosphate phosphodiesterase epsilon-1-like protein [Dinothrombium tinctorium]RWS05679.1 1-phosphatidylinositol-4:5-bisphosphate phosphodiesterase epsilon-1-like protein [Dinothrombium tinctorium]RWS05680.1 1-phosphatidylinositol-4:5-bisphosphate phosphodiesterase epsilon-1-like protein [Dinothrombium tinctorium]
MRISRKPSIGYFDRYEDDEEYGISERLYMKRDTISAASSSFKDSHRKSLFRNHVGGGGKRSNFITAVGGVTRKTTSVLRNWVTSSLAASDRHTRGATINLRECLPPMYHNTKGMAKAVKEQKRKLFHSQIYESEIQLKKLYLQTCKRLPAYGCQMFQVKEILRGKTTKRRVTRLLGLGVERIFLLDSKTLTPAKCQSTKDLLQWRTGGGRSHDRLILEFRTTKWSVATTPGALRAIGNALWCIMQDIDGQFLNQLLVMQSDRTTSDEGGVETRRPLNLFHVTSDTAPAMHYKEELEALQSILHFPEEVALRLSEVEYELFYSVPPVDYIRHITVNATRNETSNASTLDYTTLRHFYRNCDSNVINAAHGGGNLSSKGVTVQDLVIRFNEVSSWVTHLIISQPTHDDRKALLSCIIRVAQSAWNLGAFNTSLEILAGLK